MANVTFGEAVFIVCALLNSGKRKNNKHILPMRIQITRKYKF